MANPSTYPAISNLAALVATGYYKKNPNTNKKENKLAGYTILCWCPVGPVLPHEEKVPL